MSDHALRLLDARKLAPSPTNLAYAKRRVLAAGRLAELGGHMIPGVLRVRSVEYGDADAMTAGSMFAEVWLDAEPHTWQAVAGQLMKLEELAAARQGQPLRLTLAVYRASRWDRWRERLAWTVRRQEPITARGAMRVAAFTIFGLVPAAWAVAWMVSR